MNLLVFDLDFVEKLLNSSEVLHIVFELQVLDFLQSLLQDAQFCF